MLPVFSGISLIIWCILCLACGPVWAGGVTLPVSCAANRGAANGWSAAAGISADGRYVVFRSAASNVVGVDTNAVADIFLADTQTGACQRVSVSSTGAEANGASSTPAISADGRYVAFRSAATNLVAGDTNGVADIFLYERETGVTTRVSVSGSEAQGNGVCVRPAISADGRYIAFASSATNLVSGDTNGVCDIFLRDRVSGTTERISVTGSGQQANGESGQPAISGDGALVAFVSCADNLATGDTNEVADVFVRDRHAKTLTRVSVSADGTGANADSWYPAISGDGRYIVYASYATNLLPDDTNCVADIFLYDRQGGKVERVSLPGVGGESDAASFDPVISADGRYVAFTSLATNLAPEDANGALDVFLRDRQAGTTTLMSTSATNAPGDGPSYDVAMCADGHACAFSSLAASLVPYTPLGQEVLLHLSLPSHPDLWVQVGSTGTPVGDDVYNAEQRVTRKSAGSVSYRVTLQNDSAAPDALLVRGTPGAEGWRVRYWTTATPAQEITPAVTQGGWTTPDLAPGDTCAITATVSHDLTIPRGTVFAVEVTGLSLGDALSSDTVSAATTYDPLASLRLTVAPASPRNIGTPIVLTASAGGGDIEYRFRAGRQAEDGTLRWTELGPYAPTATCTWTPTLGGTYRLVVMARMVGSPVPYDVYTSLPYTVLVPPLTGVTLTLAPATGVHAATPVTLTAAATGGTAEYQFRLGYRTVEGTWNWRVLRDYAPEPTLQWVPEEGRTYSVVVYARAVGRKTGYDVYTAVTCPVVAPLSAVELAADLAAPQPAGTAVTLRAAPVGGTRVEYRFRAGYKDGETWVWVTLRNYATVPTCRWTQADPRAYTLVVHAREQGSTAMYEQYATVRFEITAPPGTP